MSEKKVNTLQTGYFFKGSSILMDLGEQYIQISNKNPHSKFSPTQPDLKDALGMASNNLPTTCHVLGSCKHCLIIRHGNKHHPFSKPHIVAETYQAALQRLKQLHPDTSMGTSSIGWGEDSNISDYQINKDGFCGFLQLLTAGNSMVSERWMSMNVESQSSIIGRYHLEAGW